MHICWGSEQRDTCSHIYSLSLCICICIIRVYNGALSIEQLWCAVPEQKTFNANGNSEYNTPFYEQRASLKVYTLASH